MTPQTKPAQEARPLDIIAHSEAELVVLARYMRILSTELDEGPIIEQVVERVEHSCEPDQLLATGRDMECLALSRALKLQIERRVFLNGNRTVVLH
ncbi:formyltetrahydrofolate hydrolase [Janthinobacterium sp. CG_23.3]|nr:formyltetrahydrofolate hydrolase [Janthinobacterium sp. CG_S6]